MDCVVVGAGVVGLAAARSLARELVVLARAEALTQLGERDRGVDMVAAWMRSGTA